MITTARDFRPNEKVKIITDDQEITGCVTSVNYTAGYMEPLHMNFEILVDSHKDCRKACDCSGLAAAAFDYKGIKIPQWYKKFYISDYIDDNLVKSKPKKPDIINLDVDRIIYNDPATIVFWGDGSKTVVKCSPGEKFSKYHGFCAALTKHVYECNNQINKLVNSGIDTENPLKTASKIPDSKPLKAEKTKKMSKKGKKS